MDRDIVVIGGSACVLDPLKQIAADLRRDLPAAVAICVHTSATAKSALAPILNRSGGLQEGRAGLAGQATDFAIAARIDTRQRSTISSSISTSAEAW